MPSSNSDFTVFLRKTKNGCMNWLDVLMKTTIVATSHLTDDERLASCIFLSAQQRDWLSVTL
jgi:hypothetical protein